MAQRGRWPSGRRARAPSTTRLDWAGGWQARRPRRTLWRSAACGFTPTIAWLDGLRAGDIPYLITPAGTLSPVALAISRRKKWLTYRWFVREQLAGASVLQALAPGEVDDIRGYGLKQPIVLIPNGVDVQEHPGPRKRRAPSAGASTRRGYCCT